jgi:hypothetical protein
MDDLRCRLSLNESHADRREKIEQYWSMTLHVPLSQFTKTTLIHSKWRKQCENKNDYFGVVSVYARKSTNLSYLVDGGIAHLREIGGLMV